jgi:hypothetical protein
MNKTIDIRDYPEVIEIINGIINNHGVAEVKNEKRQGEVNLVVVEISRTVKTKKPK